jgi:hypothetical protein
MSDTVIDSCRCASRSHDTFQSSCLTSTNLHRIQARLARIIQEYRREAAETEAWRGFSQVRATQADLRSVEETEREKPRQAMGSAAVAGIHELSGPRALLKSAPSSVLTRKSFVLSCAGLIVQRDVGDNPGPVAGHGFNPYMSIELSGAHTDILQPVAALHGILIVKSLAVVLYCETDGFATSLQ